MVVRILLTGFGPFGSHEVNPSGELAQKLDGKGSPTYEIIGRVVPLNYLEIPRIIEQWLVNYQPDVVVSTGVFRALFLSLEQKATNWVDTKSTPYDCGTILRGVPLDPTGRAVYESSLPLELIFRTLKSKNIPVVLSNDAGVFACNQLFYILMHLIQNQCKGPIGGFIHVPPVYTMELPVLESAFQIIFRTIAQFLITSIP